MTLAGRIAAISLQLLLLPNSATALEPDPSTLRPLCDGKFGLCRYVDRATNQEVIAARFERGMPFREGLAAVRIDGRFGYIDRRGEVVIPPRFDLAGDFYNGLAEILVGSKTGVINRKGEIVVPPSFQRAIPLTEDVILAAEGNWTANPNWTGEPLPRHSIHASKFGLYHVSGHWIRRPSLTFFFRLEHDGRVLLLWATEKEVPTPQFGLLASNGEWLVEPQYERVRPQRNQYTIVAKRIEGTLQFGVVDPTGQLVVPLQSSELRAWPNGWSMAQQPDPPWKYVTLDQWHPAPPEPPSKNVKPNGPLDCGHGLKIVQRDGKWGIRDIDGKDVIAPDYRAVTCFVNGVAWVPIDSRREWCAFAPNGTLRGHECRVIHYPVYIMHASPEELHSDPFESSVLWNRALLEFASGWRDSPPQWVPHAR